MFSFNVIKINEDFFHFIWLPCSKVNLFWRNKIKGCESNLQIVPRVEFNFLNKFFPKTLSNNIYFVYTHKLQNVLLSIWCDIPDFRPKLNSLFQLHIQAHLQRPRSDFHTLVVLRTKSKSINENLLIWYLSVINRLVYKGANTWWLKIWFKWRKEFTLELFYM